LSAERESDLRKSVQALASALDNHDIVIENSVCAEEHGHKDREEDKHGSPQTPSVLMLKTLRETRAHCDLHLESGDTSSETRGYSETSSCFVEAASEKSYTKPWPASPPPNTPINGFHDREDNMSFTQLWVEEMKAARAKGHEPFEMEDDETTYVSDA